MKIKLFFLVFIFLLTNVSACPYLYCSNFTDSDKVNDCNYVSNQGLNENEEQEILCVIWEQSYDFNNWNPEEYNIVLPDYSAQNNQIDNSRFILFFKILIFIFLNYFVLSLTKYSFFKKWLIADS